MEFFDKLFRKNDTPTFGKVQDAVMTLENQNDRIDNPTKQDLDAYLNSMFDDVNQFVTLTRAKADYGIRYMQAQRE